MRWLLRLLAPFADLVAGFHLRIGEPKLSYTDYALVLSLLRPGDVILSKESWRPTNVFIRGKYKHAAMFVGRVHAADVGDGLVEATHPTARFTNLVAVWQSASRVAVLRPKFTDAAGAQAAALAARSFVGTPYDTTFAHGEEALYCSELIDAAFIAAGGSPLADARRGSYLGLDSVLLPDALRTSGHFSVVWES